MCFNRPRAADRQPKASSGLDLLIILAHVRIMFVRYPSCQADNISAKSDNLNLRFSM